MQLAKTIGKIGVLVGVCHGFVGNRMLAPRQREANKLAPRRRHALGRRPGALRFRLPDGTVRDGATSPASTSAGRKADLAQRERCATSSARWTAAARRPAPASTTTTRAATRRPRRWSRRSIRDFAAKPAASARRAIPDEEILERCIYPMINEGAKILEEGKADPRLRHRRRSGSTATAGPSIAAARCSTATPSASAEVLERMREFEARFGDDFKPAAAARAPRRRGQGIFRPLTHRPAEGDAPQPPMITVGQPMAILFGGPMASTMVSPTRQAGSLLMKTVVEPSTTTPGPCGGSGSGVAQT